MDKAIASAIALTQVLTDPALGSTFIEVVAVVQNHQLHIAKSGFDGIIVGAGFRQADPV